jgi:mannose-1-phosphate guanylyltransferase
MKALILAGGFGKRLRPYTESIPKPLLEVAGKPIMIWQFEWLRKYGIDEVIVCAGYLKEKIIEKVGNGSRYSIKAGYVIEEEPLGKGGAIKNAEHLLKSEDSFLVVNGDVLTDINPKRLFESLGGDTIGSIAVTPLPSPYGIVEYRKDDFVVTAFREKPKLKDYWINAGVYAFTRDIFDYLPERGEVEERTFPQLANRGALVAVEYPDALWISVDSHKDLEEAAKAISRPHANA